MLRDLIKKPSMIESQKANSEFLEAGFRTLVYTTGGILLVSYILANLLAFWVHIPKISVVMVILAAFSWLAVSTIPKDLQAAQLIWLIGWFLAITTVVNFSQISELSYLFLILPIMAATLMGWVQGLFMTAFLLLFYWFVPNLSILPGLPALLSLVTIIVGGVGAFVTASYFYSLRNFSQWVIDYYHTAREERKTTQEQRVEFMEVQEDLVLANKELKRMADQLDILYQRAEEARRAKEEFVANVSHELRTPLNMIIGFSDVIMKSPQLYGANIPASLLADIASIHRNSQHLSRLVDDVLDLSQVEAQKMAITKEWSSIQQIIEEAVDAVQALYQTKGLYLKSEISANIPPAYCDSTRIRQVVINLLSNAGRYTVKGGVYIRAWAEGRDFIISVSDTGPGIPAEDLESLFQPFKQLGTPNRREGGSGLGLSISKQFVEMHEGEMWVESEVGVGATFFVRIPVNTIGPLRRQADLNWERYLKEEGQVEVRSREIKISAPVAKPMYLLVEEGNTLQRLFTRYMDNVDVIAKNNIDEAIEEMKVKPFQALILNSPESTFEMDESSSLNRLPLGTPVFSCWVPGKDEVARKLGVMDYLLKPVSQEDIFSAIESLDREIHRILLVDDEPELLQLFTRMLSASPTKFQILQAVDGKRALNLIRTRKPDVILLDLIMPGVDGFQILREKSRDESIRNIPVIVVSSINPTGETIISNSLTVTRKEGLSVDDLLGSIQSINRVLTHSPNSYVG